MLNASGTNSTNDAGLILPRSKQVMEVLLNSLPLTATALSVIDYHSCKDSKSSATTGWPLSVAWFNTCLMHVLLLIYFPIILPDVVRTRLSQSCGQSFGEP